MSATIASKPPHSDAPAAGDGPRGKLNHFINGKSVPPASGAYMDNHDPRTAQKIGSVALGDKADVAAAVAAARAAFPAWRDLKPMERSRILFEIARKIRAHAKHLAEIESMEAGKPASFVPRELGVAADYFEFYGSLANALHGEVIDTGVGYHTYTRREPFGVVGVITPWNVPLNQAARACSPALAAGNTVVCKPSEKTSGTTLAMAQFAVEECGLPPGVLNVVVGTGPQAGAALVSDPGVRKVSFTGSVRAGREIGHIAAERVIPLTLEMGGKSPDIIFDDADLSQVIPNTARIFTRNCGQICSAGTRLLVQESIHDKFVAELVKAVAAVRFGPDANDEVGPLATAGQYEKVQSYYEIARQEGATAAIGGALPTEERLRKGWFVTPTVYTGVTNQMRIAREEIFGPVAVVIPFKDEEDAIRIANDSDYGLAAGLWTGSISRALRVSARLEAGQVYVNEYQTGAFIEAPFGGYKMSGYGREKGMEALQHYLQVKCVTIKI
jgi:aldehyde dehydrogenase (NAD+)